MVEGNENYTVLGVPGTVRRMMDLHKCSDYNQKMNFYYKRHDDTTPTSYLVRPTAYMTRCDYGKEKEQEKATYMQDVMSCREDRTHQHR